MTQENINELIMEMLKGSMEIEDAENIDGPLDQYDWDSIAVITFLSQINEKFNAVVAPSELAKVTTVEGVIDLAISNIKSTTNA